jgi:hypothetical protein
MSVWSWILKAPLLVTFLFSIIAGFYAAANSIEDISYASPVVLSIFAILYIWGESKAKKQKQG